VGGLPVSGVTITAGIIDNDLKSRWQLLAAVNPLTVLKVDAQKAGFATTFDTVLRSAGQSIPTNFTLQNIGLSKCTITNLTTTNAHRQ